MKDGLGNIKERLIEESAHQATEEDWNGFVNYTATKETEKSRSWRIIVFIALLLIISSYFLFKNQVQSDQTLKADSIQQEQAFADKQNKLITHDNDSAILDDQSKDETIAGNASDTFMRQKLASNNSRKEGKVVLKNNTVSSTKEEGSNYSQARSFANYIKSNESLNVKGNYVSEKEMGARLDHVIVTEDGKHDMDVKKVNREMISNLKVLPLRDNEILKDTDYLRLSNWSKIEILKKSSQWATGFQLNSGSLRYEKLNTSYNVQFGINSEYNLTKKIAFRTSVHLDQYNYNSSEFIPEIGLDFTDAPRANQELGNVRAQSYLVSGLIGLRYFALSKKDFNLFLGTSSGLVKVLDRNIEYGFEGEQNGNNEDDDQIEINDNDLESFYSVFQIEIGLRRKIKKKWSFELSTSFQGQVLGSDNSLPQQLGLNIGLIRKW